MPIYISSRASGYIDDDGNVTLDTIYTYDIVYRPGFKVAELKRANKDNNTSEGKLVQLHESGVKYSGKSSSIMLLEWKEPIENTKINNKRKTDSNMERDNKDKNKPATIGDLDKIYEAINGQLDLLKKTLNVGDDLHIKSGRQFLHENKNEANVVAKLESTLSKKFASAADVSELSKKLNSIMKWSELVRKAVNEQDSINKKHHRHINMVVNRINESGEITADNVNSVVEQLKKDTAILKKYADINTSFVNKMAERQELMYEHANLTTKRFNAMVDNVNENNGVVAGLKSNIQLINEHSNLSTKFINDINSKIANMSKKVNEEFNDDENAIIADFNSLVAGDYSPKEAYDEILNNYDDESLTDSVKKELKKLSRVTESKKSGKGKIDIKKISTRVDESIKSAKKKITDKVVANAVEQYPFISVLQDTEITAFSKMNDVKKKMISDRIYENGVEDRNEILNVIQNVNLDKGMVRMLSNMPNRVRPIWNNMSKREKQQIVSLYSIKSLNNDLKVKAFWESLSFDNKHLQKINENFIDGVVDLEFSNEDTGLGYDDNDIKNSLNV
jgi:uncharacterized protein (DUF1697 family)